MKIRVHTETFSGLKPGVYDAHKSHNNVFAHQPIGVSTLALNHYISPDNYEIVPRPASGMGERVMTTTSQLTCATMLRQGFNVRVRSTKTGRYVKWDDTVINTNGSRPVTTDYTNQTYTLRYVVPNADYVERYHDDGSIQNGIRQVLNVNGKVTFDETYHGTLSRRSMYQMSLDFRHSNYVFEIFA